MVLLLLTFNPATDPNQNLADYVLWQMTNISDDINRILPPWPPNAYAPGSFSMLWQTLSLYDSVMPLHEMFILVNLTLLAWAGFTLLKWGLKGLQFLRGSG